MQKSESIAQLAAALSQAQAEFPTVAKSADNPFFKSKYATLASIIEAVQPTLGKHGLSVSQLVSTDVEKKLVIVASILMHKSGEYISGEFSMPVTDWKAQGLGSAITYASRYSLAPLLRVASDKDDDDGNAASGRDSKADNEFAPKPKATQSTANAVKSAPTAAVNTAQAPTTEAAASPERSPSCLDPRQVKVFWQDCKRIGATEAMLRGLLKESYGVESTKDVQIGWVPDILEMLRKLVPDSQHGTKVDF